MTNTIIREARPEDIPAARALVVEFVRQLPVSVDFQDVHGEIDDFPDRFESVIIAETSTGEIVGVVALKDLADVGEGFCEMKRMYVSPAVRGSGVGEEMVARLLSEARNRGYQRMVLDTLERLAPAVRLYERCGFTRRNAYYDNPYDDAVFMEYTI